MFTNKKRYIVREIALFFRDASSSGKLPRSIGIGRLRSGNTQKELFIGIQAGSQSDPRIRRKSDGPSQDAQVSAFFIFFFYVTLERFSISFRVVSMMKLKFLSQRSDSRRSGASLFGKRKKN